jgi:hypothetical protein
VLLKHAVTRGPQFSHGIKVTPGDVLVASVTNVRRWVTIVMFVDIEGYQLAVMPITITISPSSVEL